MGKGSGQRPRSVPYDEYAANYDRIFGKRAVTPEDVGRRLAKVFPAIYALMETEIAEGVPEEQRVL